MGPGIQEDAQAWGPAQPSEGGVRGSEARDQPSPAGHFWLLLSFFVALDNEIMIN